MPDNPAMDENEPEAALFSLLINLISVVSLPSPPRLANFSTFEQILIKISKVLYDCWQLNV